MRGEAPLRERLSVRVPSLPLLRSQHCFSSSRWVVFFCVIVVYPSANHLICLGIHVQICLEVECRGNVRYSIQKSQYVRRFALEAFGGVLLLALSVKLCFGTHPFTYQ